MRFVLTSVLALGLLTAVGFAQAEEASGVIVAVDPEKRVIMLDNGESYTLAEGIDIDGLQPGAEVLVSFEEQSDGKVAVEVAPTQ